MKFVTVMDMWLLIINIGLMGYIIYFGRNLLKTMTRLMHVGEHREDAAERKRIIKIIEAELEHYRVIDTMHSDSDSKTTISVLEFILDSVKKGK